MGFIADVKKEFSELDPKPKDLRNLGLVFLAALGLIGGFAWWGGKPWGPWTVGVGALFGVWGLVWPAGLKPIFRLWMGLALIMGWFVSRILLGLLFVLVLTPTGLLLRLTGKDLLDMKMRDRDSYWHIRPDEPYDPASSEKMY